MGQQDIFFFSSCQQRMNSLTDDVVQSTSVNTTV